MKKQPCAWDGWILAVLASKLGLEDEGTLSTCRHGEVTADRDPGTHGEKSGNECFSWQKDGQEMGRNLRGLVYFIKAQAFVGREAVTLLAG